MTQFNTRRFESAISHFSDPVRTMVLTVLEVGLSLEDSDGQDEIISKSGLPGDGPQFSTKADFRVQEEVLSRLLDCFPEARFIIEEKTKKFTSSLITEGNLAEVFSSPLIYGVDPIDGTNQFWHRLWEYSISVGVMVRGVHTGGVIFAPGVRDGMIVAGERGKGVFVAEKNGSCLEQTRVSSDEKKKSLIFTGVGLAMLPAYNRFVNCMANKVLMIKSTGSCALGLAAVAAGRVGILVQPPQRPYDWFAGYPLVEEAGGKFQFYHYRKGRIEPLEKPDLLSYSPDRLEVGFIAGDPSLVDWAFELLTNEWGKLV